MNNLLKSVWLVSFADSRMYRALHRVYRQALKMGFDPKHIFTLNENDLDADFRDRMKDHLILGSRGYGYWCWKPQVVLQTFSKMTSGNVLIYMDAGCHLNTKGLPRLLEYVKLAIENGFIAFQIGKQHTIGRWTKGDLLDHFNVRNIKDVILSPQCEAGVFVCVKSKKNIEFITQWLQVYYDRFSLVDDSPSVSPNLPEFSENRHDQSVYAILCKINNVAYLPAAEIERTDDKTKPILAGRDCEIGWRAYMRRDIRAKIVNFMRMLHLHK